MKKYLNIGLTTLFLISSSNIVHSGTLEISKAGDTVYPDLCLKVVNKGNVLFSERYNSGIDLTIVYEDYLYYVYIRYPQNQILCTPRASLTFD